MDFFKPNEKIIVCILNGKPRSGKDTFADLILDELETMYGIKGYHLSSITRCKSALPILIGQDYNMSETHRSFLSKLKALCSEYDFINDGLAKDIEYYRSSFNYRVFFIDIREPNEIDSFREYLKTNNEVFLELSENGFPVPYNIIKTRSITCISYYIKNENVPNITSNPSDANVWQYSYDRYIDNSGTIDDLKITVMSEAQYLSKFLRRYSNDTMHNQGVGTEFLRKRFEEVL